MGTPVDRQKSPESDVPTGEHRPEIRRKTAVGIIVSILVMQALGAAAGWAGPDTHPEWYASLVKSPSQPAGWIFGVVWSLLYALMGVAAFLVYLRREHPAAKTALTLFAVQLVLNLSWSTVFFAWQLEIAAFVLLLVILSTALATTIWFARVKLLAGWLMVPYIAWLFFAAYVAYSN